MEHADYQAQSRRRLLVQSLVWVIVIITIFGGLRYPPLGFVVAAVMTMGIIGARRCTWRTAARDVERANKLAP